MAVVVNRVEKKWYDFVTGLLAVLGGAFAVARLGSRAAEFLFGG